MVEECSLRWNGGHADVWHDGSAAAEVECGGEWVNCGEEVSCAAECDA